MTRSESEAEFASGLATQLLMAAGGKAELESGAYYYNLFALLMGVLEEVERQAAELGDPLHYRLLTEQIRDHARGLPQLKGRLEHETAGCLGCGYPAFPEDLRPNKAGELVCPHCLEAMS